MITLWHCRLEANSYVSPCCLLSRQLCTVLATMHSPYPTSILAFTWHPSPPLLIQLHSESSLLQLVLHRQKPCQKTSATHNLQPQSCFSKVTRNDLMTPPPSPAETFASSDIPTRAPGMSAPAKVYSTVVFVWLQALKQDSLVLQRNSPLRLLTSEATSLHTPNTSHTKNQLHSEPFQGSAALP